MTALVDLSSSSIKVYVAAVIAGLAVIWFVLARIQSM